MSEFPTKEFPRDLAGVLASPFSGGLGPSGSALSSAIAAAGIEEQRVTGTNKEAKVLSAFTVGTIEQRYRLADELIMLLRNNGAFQHPLDKDWAIRTRRAFTRAGFTLDEDGYVDWKDNLASFVEPIGAVAAETVRITEAAHAARARAAAEPDEVIGGTPRRPRVAAPSLPPSAEKSDSEPQWKSGQPMEIFLVHGHDEHARLELETFITRTTGVIPTVLMAMPSGGKTVIEKFEQFADRSGYAVVLMTEDDLGNEKARASAGDLKGRPRQNVVFEFGYFVGTLRRSHVAALVSPGVEKPSDVAGLVYISYEPGKSDWKLELQREMREAGIPIVG